MLGFPPSQVIAHQHGMHELDSLCRSLGNAGAATGPVELHSAPLGNCQRHLSPLGGDRNTSQYGFYPGISRTRHIRSDVS